MEAAARSTFEINNNVQLLGAADQAFLYDDKALRQQSPWDNDPHYFQTVKISAVALIKMTIHARSGGQYEIMGVMYGKVRDHTFWIMDAAALPVQGTETRVNAGVEAYEYMVQFQAANKTAGKNEELCGWYHSHPGYGCWLSGIDVNTQLTNQKFTDPYLAVVIDPNRTVSAGKVEIGAFRTFPEGYTPPASGSSEYQSIPIDKIEDFGAHANAYYPLNIEIYKTKADEQLLELLWNKYWVATLSQSLILTNRSYGTSQIRDLNAKLNSTTDGKLSESVSELKLKAPPPTLESGDKSSKKKEDPYVGVEATPTALSGPHKDSLQISNEIQNGVTVQVIKNQLFNQRLDSAVTPEAASLAVSGTFTALS